MTAIAIIPARGGSKRIPKKNMKAFHGKPLIAYSIEAAQQTGLFDIIMVSTDCPEIAQVAKHYGAEVPFVRPSDLSDDYTGTRPVTNHAIEYYQQQGRHFDYACCIYATAPFIQAEYLQQGHTKLVKDESKAFSFSVCSFAFPIQRAISIKDKHVEVMFPEHIKKRSQDLVEAYHDAGQFYWGRVSDYLSKKAMFSEHSIPIVLPRHLVQDIDTPEDWQRAELMYQAYLKNNNNEE